jgi:hypothetical protein
LSEKRVYAARRDVAHGLSTTHPRHVGHDARIERSKTFEFESADPAIKKTIGLAPGDAA